MKMAEKLAQYRATHGNPEGSDYTFIPNEDGTALLGQVWNVVKGFCRQKNIDALAAKAVDPRNPQTRIKMLDAHDTNQWLLGEGKYDTSLKPYEQPEEPKKKKGRRHHH